MVSPVHTAEFIDRLLDVVQHDIVLKTASGVQSGNKIFGAAVVLKSDLSLVCADTNKETEWPLLHGEISCLRTLNGQPPELRPEAKDCIFIATHEPCSLCLSAITWSGYDNFYYLFSYQDTRDAFKIPHDLKILREVFKCDNGNHAHENAFWACHDIIQLIENLADDSAKLSLQLRVAALRARYEQLSEKYQDAKADNNIPLQ